LSKKGSGTLATYILCHGMDIRVWPIVHHRICKHQIDVALEFEGVGNDAVFDSRLDCFEIHWPLDNFMIIWRLRVLDRIVENIAIAVLRYLRMEHANNVLKAFGGDLFFRSSGVPGHTSPGIVRRRT